MFDAQLLTGATMTALAVPMVGMFVLAYRHSESPGSRGFLLVLSGAILWSVAAGSIVLFANETVFRLTWGGRLLGANLLAIGWAVLVLDYTRRRRVPIRWWGWAALLFVPILGQMLYATNDLHHLVVAPGTTIDAAGVVDIRHGPWFYVHGFYNYVILLGLSTAVLLRDFVDADGIHRTQIAVLLAGMAVAVAASIGYVVDLPIPGYIDPAPFGFLLTMSLWTAALFRFDLFNVVPIARKTAIDTIPDAIVVFDPQDRVVDVNESGRRLFNLESVPTGLEVEAFFAEYPVIIQRYHSGDENDVEISVVVDGRVRHLSATIRPIEYRGDRDGTLVLLRDVTTLKARENDLELLQKVFSRVLRHNMRNDLQVIRGHAAMIAEREDDEDAAVILEVTDDLLETSEKARQMEGIVDTADERVVTNPIDTIETVVDWIRRRYPKAIVETSASTDAWCLAHDSVATAVENLVENAIVHAEDNHPRVDVVVDESDGWVTISVADRGPGIPDHEVAVLERGDESALEHGSGAGLWLVNWIAEKSEGSLEFRVGERGTTATLWLPAATGEGYTGAATPKTNALEE